MEMMIAVTIFSVVAISLLQHLTISYSSSRNHRERVFAYTKAQAILAEMHALVDSGATAAAIDLDVFDDGVFNNPVLSIESQGGVPILPDSPLSGNTMASSYLSVATGTKAVAIDSRSCRSPKSPGS